MLEALEAIMRKLGGHLIEWRTEGMTCGHWEGSQFKAEADQRAHDFLSGQLRRSWPDLPVISEEDSDANNSHRPDVYWLIDPIDGTASYCHGFDGFVTQAALIRNRKPILAVVHAPALGLTYTASLDGPAKCNGLRISMAAPVRAPILIDNYPEPRGIALSLYEQIGCGGYVESGSIGLKICRVADGTADLFVKDVVVRDWDLAPADLILSRSGGVLTTLSGECVPYDREFARAGLIACGSRELLVQVAILAKGEAADQK
jgi:3'(2'), 5'-bisphosphate nucleotidase